MSRSKKAYYFNDLFFVLNVTLSEPFSLLGLGDGYQVKDIYKLMMFFLLLYF